MSGIEEPHRDFLKALQFYSVVSAFLHTETHCTPQYEETLWRPQGFCLLSLPAAIEQGIHTLLENHCKSLKTRVNTVIPLR